MKNICRACGEGVLPIGPPMERQEASFIRMSIQPRLICS